MDVNAILQIIMLNCLLYNVLAKIKRDTKIEQQYCMLISHIFHCYNHPKRKKNQIFSRKHKIQNEKFACFMAYETSIKKQIS